MNRASFLKELKSSLLRTSYEATQPLFQEDISRTKAQWMTLQGYDWYPVNGFSFQTAVHWIHEEAFLIKQIDQDWLAWALTCPHCRSSLNHQSFSGVTRCFHCDLEWTPDQAVDQLDYRPVRFIEGQLHILHKKKR